METMIKSFKLTVKALWDLTQFAIGAGAGIFIFMIPMVIIALLWYKIENK